MFRYQKKRYGMCLFVKSCREIFEFDILCVARFFDIPKHGRTIIVYLRSATKISQLLLTMSGAWRIPTGSYPVKDIQTYPDTADSPVLPQGNRWRSANDRTVILVSCHTRVYISSGYCIWSRPESFAICNPRFNIFIAAFVSLWWCILHRGQSHSRTASVRRSSPFIRYPQLLHVWVVFCGGTRTTVLW